MITNVGGQVQVGPNDPGAGYIRSMGGGSGWVLIGRYDADSKTGDAAFPGHHAELLISGRRSLRRGARVAARHDHMVVVEAILPVHVDAGERFCRSSGM